MDDISLDLNGTDAREMVDEMLDILDFDCSLPSTDFSLSSQSSSTDDGSSIDFHELLQGITNFLYTAKEDGLAKGATDQTANEKPVGPKKKKKDNLKKGQRYLPNFKRKVLNYAVKHTFKETATKFNINCNTLTEWAREYKRLLQLKKSTTPRPGSTLKTDVSSNLAKTDETDAQNQRPSQASSDVKFIHWLRNERLQGTQVDRKDVQAAALAFLQADCSKGTDWFTCWVRRLFEKANSPRQVTKEAPKADPRIFYPDSFKLEVALYAKEYTKKEAANTFCVSSRRLYEWCPRQDGAPGTNDPKSVMAIKRLVEAKLLLWFNQRCAAGDRPKGHELSSEARALYAENGLPHVKCSHGWLEKLGKRLDLKLSHYDDDLLLAWVLAQLDENRSLSVGQVTSKAQQLANEKKGSSFKGSKGWTLRFLKRHSHVLQCWSARLNDLPAISASQARLFRRNVHQRVSAACLVNESFGCMDEVPITFIYPTDKTTTPTPRLLRKAALESAHAVAILAATSDGCLLPPAVVLKGESPMQVFHAKEVSLPVFYQREGTVDADILIEWFHHVWMRSVKAPSVLVADSFPPHKDERFNETLSTGCCHIAIIPTGCGVHLQPCGYNLSRRFQETIQEAWHECVTRRGGTEWGLKTGPDEEAILNWVINAYLVLREDRYSISSGFHLTGLTKPTCSGFELMSNPDVYINKTDARV